MLNEKKISLMTKMAIYEKEEGRKSFPMSKYYRSDYLSLRLINSVILTTLAYVMVVALAVVVNVEKILEELVTIDLLNIGKHLLISYIVLIVVSMLMTYLIFGHRFKQYRRGLNGYNGNLKKLYAMNRHRENAGGKEDEEFADD